MIRLILCAIALLALAACDGTAPTAPAGYCPVPWLPGACPDSVRVTP